MADLIFSRLTVCQKLTLNSNGTKAEAGNPTFTIIQAKKDGILARMVVAKEARNDYTPDIFWKESQQDLSPLTEKCK